MKTAHFTLTPKPPYSFDLTAGYLAYFQGRYGADRFEDGVFSRLLDIDGKLALLVRTPLVSIASINSTKSNKW